MSYLVLARKWRPQSFDEVVGQPHVTKTLRNAVRLKRTAHAYLFTGARGVGKTSVARILAKTLNCEVGTDASPCGECSNCREIAQGKALDVIEVDGASNRGIDSIRELRETVRYRPTKSNYKIYIIDEVHMLTTEAFNALLKTLEEPPEHVVFIFATTEPHKIPSTILSRCQRFDFRRIATQLIVSHLRQILMSETVQISDSVLYAVAREADGSMRDAQSLLEQILAFSSDSLKDEEILDVLGVVDRSSVHLVGEAILAGNVETCLQVVGDLYRRGIDSRRFCQQLCDYFRSLLFLALGGDKVGAHIDLPEEEKNLLRNQLKKSSPESLDLYFQLILRGEEEIRRSSLPRMSLEMLLLRLAQLPRLQSLNVVVEMLTSLEDRVQQAYNTPLGQQSIHRAVVPTCRETCNQESSSLSENAVLKAHPETVPEPARAPVQEFAPDQEVPAVQPVVPPSRARPADPVVCFSQEQAVEQWVAFLLWLDGREPVLAAKLSQSRLLSATDTIMEIEVKEGFVESLMSGSSQDRLTGAAAEYFGRSFKWAIKPGAALRSEAKDSHLAGHHQLNTRRLVLEHPIVQHTLEILGGELIDIKHGKNKHTT